MQDPGILIVDDNKINRLILKRFIEEIGFECEETDSGKSAIEFFIKNQPKLVFMDLQMPEMSGIQATKKIFEKVPNSETKVIAVSATPFDRLQKQCQGVPFHDFLSKPYNREHLKALFNKFF